MEVHTNPDIVSRDGQGIEPDRNGAAQLRDCLAGRRAKRCSVPAKETGNNADEK